MTKLLLLYQHASSKSKTVFIFKLTVGIFQLTSKNYSVTVTVNSNNTGVAKSRMFDFAPMIYCARTVMPTTSVG
jgi:hypothetical protein